MTNMAISKFQATLFMVLLLLLANCAPKTLYSWNGYDDVVLEYYKNPAEREEFVEALAEIIVEAEESGNIPPGLYAEYGYVFYEEGVYDQAIVYFQKEHAVWPESRFFMNKMIRNANLQKKQGNKNSADLESSEGKSP